MAATVPHGTPKAWPTGVSKLFWRSNFHNIFIFSVFSNHMHKRTHHRSTPPKKVRVCNRHPCLFPSNVLEEARFGPVLVIYTNPKTLAHNGVTNNRQGTTERRETKGHSHHFDEDASRAYTPHGSRVVVSLPKHLHAKSRESFWRRKQEVHGCTSFFQDI